MTVQEFIDLLLKFNPSLEIVVERYDWECEIPGSLDSLDGIELTENDNKVIIHL